MVKLLVNTLQALEYLILAAMLALQTVCITGLLQTEILGYKVPIFAGYQFVSIMSGSMHPTLNVGDLAVCKEQDSYNVGDAILFYDESCKALVLHRIDSLAGEEFVTKGDANNTVDSNKVNSENIIGKLVGKLDAKNNIRLLHPGATTIWTSLQCLFVYMQISLLRDIMADRLEDKHG